MVLANNKRRASGPKADIPIEQVLFARFVEVLLPYLLKLLNC